MTYVDCASRRYVQHSVWRTWSNSNTIACAQSRSRSAAIVLVTSTTLTMMVQHDACCDNRSMKLCSFDSVRRQVSGRVGMFDNSHRSRPVLVSNNVAWRTKLETTSRFTHGAQQTPQVTSLTPVRPPRLPVTALSRRFWS